MVSLLLLLCMLLPNFTVYAEEPSPEIMNTTYIVSETADNKEIQKALNKAKNIAENEFITVIIPAGTHILTKRLRIFSNTTLRLEEGAVMEAHFTAESNPGNGLEGSMLYSSHLNDAGELCNITTCAHTDYDRTKNIVVEGGIWDRRSNIDAGAVTGIINLRYATNVTVRDMVLCNATEHFMNVSATQNTLVENVTFRDQIVYSNKSDYSFWTGYTVKERYAFCEALHVDYMQQNDENGNVSNQYLGSRDVTIQNCLFENVYAGIGTHHKLAATMANISIKNNTFTNVSGRAIGAFGYENVQISGNTYTLEQANKTSYFIYAYKGYGTIENNTVVGCRSFLYSTYGKNYQIQSNQVTGSKWHAFYLDTCSGMTFTGNTIDSTANSSFYLTDNSSATIQDNTGTAVGTHFIYAYDGCNVTAASNICNSTGKTFVTIGKESFANITSNTISNSGSYGINIAGMSKATVTNNTITSTTLSGILLNTTEKSSLIQSNRLEQVGTYGIEVTESGKKLQLLDNRITNAGNCDIKVEKAKKCILSGNLYYFTSDVLKYQVITAQKKVAVIGITDKKVKALTIPAKVTSGDYSYKVVQIGEKALRNCKNLKEVTIGKNVKHIQDKAFKGSSKLKFITLKCKDLKTIGYKAFGGVHKKVILYMKASKMNTYIPLFDENVIRKTKRVMEL